MDIWVSGVLSSVLDWMIKENKELSVNLLAVLCISFNLVAIQLCSLGSNLR